MIPRVWCIIWSQLMCVYAYVCDLWFRWWSVAEDVSWGQKMLQWPELPVDSNVWVYDIITSKITYTKHFSCAKRIWMWFMSSQRHFMVDHVVYLEMCSGNTHKRCGSVSKWAHVAVQPTTYSIITWSIWMEENVSMTLWENSSTLNMYLARKY